MDTRECPHCKGTKWRYLRLYNLWQCETGWCGNLMTFTGPQWAPPKERKEEKKPPLDHGVLDPLLLPQTPIQTGPQAPITVPEAPETVPDKVTTGEGTALAAAGGVFIVAVVILVVLKVLGYL